jgi:ribose-phosphate pyrophosphokinase
MIRTGGSLLNAARAYRQAGAGRLFAIATHGEFAGESFARLRASGLFQSIACTDSHPRAQSLRDQGLIVRPIAELFRPYLR